MLLTSLLKADMSESRECGRVQEPPVRASSKCSAMKGVPFPLWGAGTFRTCDSEPSFIPFIDPSTSSSESTAPQLAGDRFIQINLCRTVQNSQIKANKNVKKNFKTNGVLESSDRTEKAFASVQIQEFSQIFISLEQPNYFPSSNTFMALTAFP